MTCGSCSAPLAAEARFCQRCGAAAPEAVTPPADPIRETLKVALGRQYEVQRLLGRGGMGAVYLATEAALEREVAIKVLPPDRGATKESRDRFRREARTAAKLSHPNIVPLYTFGDVDGTLYFVMGYVKGESLAARLKREGRLPVEESRRILIEIAEALDYAHKLGVIHRDIKPDNVLLEEGTGRALLTDFGVAKALGAGQTMTEVGSVLGTPQYMSPEQAQGKADIDHRTDIYSLGVMGYGMLAGRLPFEGPTAGDIMAQHITKEAPPLKSFAPDVPAEIASALTRCLAKDRQQRFRDAASLSAALARVDDGDTPESLEDLAGMFRGIVGLGYALLLIAAWWLGGGDVSDPFPVLPSILGALAFFFALLLGSRFIHARRRGFEGHRIVREILKKPEGFPGWYPRRLRPAGDVWDRLPPSLRQAREAMGWLLLTMAVIPPPFILFSIAFNSHIIRTGRSPYSARPDPAIFLIPMLFLFGLALFRGLRWRRLALAQGIDADAVSRTMGSPTTKRSFWSRPEMAALLQPEGATVSSTAPSSPQELVAAISAALSRSGPVPTDIRDRIQEAGRELADEIAALDRQESALGSAADPAEGKRLLERLASLGPDRGPHDVNREVREILEKQLAAVRSLESKIEQARSRRAQRFEQLRRLWSHASELRSGEPAASGLASERIQLFLEEVKRDRGPQTLADGATQDLPESPTLAR